MGARRALRDVAEVHSKAEGYAWVNYYVGAKAAQFTAPYQNDTWTNFMVRAGENLRHLWREEMTDEIETGRIKGE
eukprot:588474-Prorocentrum_lima.AAC.1